MMRRRTNTHRVELEVDLERLSTTPPSRDARSGSAAVVTLVVGLLGLTSALLAQTGPSGTPVGTEDAWVIDPYAGAVDAGQPEPPAAPMPLPGETFREDSDRFKDVLTDPERAHKAGIAAEMAPAAGARPLYEQMPVATGGIQAVAGLFAAGVVGLLGGSVGNLSDSRDDDKPLAGLYGTTTGALLGSLVGSTLGVWGGGLLFDKPGGPGWTLAGAWVGTTAGAGVAAGVMFGMEPGDGATALALVGFMGLQTTGALLFNEWGRPATVWVPPRKPLPAGPQTWVIPLMQIRF